MSSASAGPLLVHDLRCEYQDNPLGSDVVRPYLSWTLASGRRGAVQSAYQLLVKDADDVRWDTAKVLSNQSIHADIHP